MNQLQRQVITGSKKAENEVNKKIYIRFLHLAQYILCNDEAASYVAKKAAEKVRTQYKELSEQGEFIPWTQQVLDDEIDKYFQDIIQQIKAGSKKAQEKLMDILYKRFSYLAKIKIQRDRFDMDSEDVNDIVQNSLITVSEKCKKAKPQGTFIQWAQTILNYKYLEHRRNVLRNSKRIERLSQKEFEPEYPRSLDDEMKKRAAKEVDPVEAEKLRQKDIDLEQIDPFQDDPYSSHPSLLVVYKDIKQHLLTIVKSMGETCKKVFIVLFSEGDRKFMHQQFPDLTRKEIDNLIHKCRSQLKRKVLKEGIL